MQLNYVVGRALWVTRAVGANTGVWGLLAAAFLALPLFLAPADTLLVAEMLILALLAMSYNLMLGYMGMASLGHAAFYGLGGYTVGILLKRYEVGFALAFVAGPILSALAGIIIGYLSVRRFSFIYFAMLTLASAQVLYAVAFKWVDFTGGDNGFIGVPVPEALRQTTNFYYFVLGIALTSMLAMYLMVNSPYGYLMRAIRENPTRAEFTGLSVMLYRLTSFVIAAFFAGLAGSLATLLQRGAFPEFLSVMKTMDALIAVLLGGMYVFFGPLVGAAIMFWLNHYVAILFPYWKLVIGIVVIFIVFFFRQGLVGFVAATAEGLRSKGVRGLVASQLGGLKAQGSRWRALARPPYIHTRRGRP